ncbi:hypothetical protein NPIL_634221 [Nephila pilipes]|uniref:Uncharacterized protein n=1 Tax=Nephila pilipes TaxID=299642 RepID=A0A8X6QQW1_NEPPI|nr:hypothetical protein NPIL_634221 [Nephila pilipes]
MRATRVRGSFAWRVTGGSGSVQRRGGKAGFFFEIFVPFCIRAYESYGNCTGIDDKTFLLDDELHSDTDTDISSNYLDYSSDDSIHELSS